MVDEVKEKVVSDSKEVSVGYSEVSEILSDAMLPFLTQQEVLTFSRVGKSRAQLREEPTTWAMRIQEDFKHNVSENEFKSSQKALLLPNHLIYQHLKIRNEIDHDDRVYRFTKNDPAIFQGTLSEEITQKSVLTRYLRKAARVGNFELVKWLVSPARGALRVYPEDTTLDAAIRSGNLALVRWLMKEDSRLKPYTLAVYNAASKGYMELVLWLIHEDRGQHRVTFTLPESLLKSVASSGKIEFVQWFIAEERGKERLRLTPSLLEKAADHNRRELIEWLMNEKRGSQRLNPNSDTLNAVARAGNLPLVQWLMSGERGIQRVQLDILTLYDAAQSGNLDLVLWLTKQGAEPSLGSLQRAASSGNLNLVEWHMSSERGELQQHPDNFTLLIAAENGHLEVMKWLVHADRGAQRLFPNRETLNTALRNGQLNIVQFLMTPQEEEEPVINPDQATLRHAIRSHNLALVQWLVDANRQEPTVTSLQQAAIVGDLEIMQWLMAEERGEQRVSPDLQTLKYAIEYGELEIIEWLVDPARGGQRILPNLETLEESLELAKRKGNKEIVDWIQEFLNTHRSTIRSEQNELKLSAPLSTGSSVIFVNPDEKSTPRLRGGPPDSLSAIPARLRGNDVEEEPSPQPISFLSDFFKKYPYFTRIATGTLSGLAAPTLLYIGFMAAGKTENFANLFSPIGGAEGAFGVGAGIGFIIGLLAIAQKYYSDNFGHSRQNSVPVGSAPQ